MLIEIIPCHSKTYARTTRLEHGVWAGVQRKVMKVLRKMSGRKISLMVVVGGMIEIAGDGKDYRATLNLP